MRISDGITCEETRCEDVVTTRQRLPTVEIRPDQVRIVMISEAVAADAADDYYAPGSPLFARTTVAAFRDAGEPVETIADVAGLGVYLTSAVKCPKTAAGIDRQTVVACSYLLERELELFPNARVYMLMGDVAITAVNAIAKRSGEPRPIPAGATYKIRGGSFAYRGRRLLPSYLQAGPAFFIEKTKRRMIAEDIAAALAIVREEQLIGE